MDILEILKEQRGFESGAGSSKEEINEAAKALDLTFAKEYQAYLAAYSSVSFYGHIFTGISPFPGVDVVKVTSEEKKNNPQIPPNYYVIEQAHIDGIVIWQDESGTIYKSQNKSFPQKEYNSLAEYVSTFASSDGLETNPGEAKSSSSSIVQPKPVSKGWRAFLKRLFG